MEAAKNFAKQVFAHFGFQATEIPVGKGRSADLRIADNTAVYQVEVKEKFDSPEDAKTRTDILATGEIFQEETPMWHDNRISGILRNAQKQLHETPKDHPTTFQLI